MDRFVRFSTLPGFGHLIPEADGLVREAFRILEQMGPHIEEEDREVERRLRLTSRSRSELAMEVWIEGLPLRKCAADFYSVLVRIDAFRAEHPQISIGNLPWEQRGSVA